MKTPKKIMFDRIMARINASAAGSTVVVGADFAKYFKAVPQDGRTYVVNDPVHADIQHWTYPDGSYARIDSKVRKQDKANILIRFNEKRTFFKDRKPRKKQMRLAEDLTIQKPVSRQSDEPPVISLIDIQRVMRIVGFRKSFIYEQEDFPQPIRLGTSKRSAVRWLEHEVNLWVQQLVAKRSNPTNKRENA